MAVRVAPQGLLWAKDASIPRRRDENDVYKILMLYNIWQNYQSMEVSFAFKNRTTTVPLAEYVSVGEINEHLQAYADMEFTDHEIAVFQSWQMFDPNFFPWLRAIKLEVPTVRKVGDQLEIIASGLWSEVTLWEIPVLYIISELYMRGYAAAHGITEQQLYDEGNRRLDEKCDIFKANQELRIADFALRRRAGALWGDHVAERLFSECGDVFTGASSMYTADLFGVEATGTNAHELPMAITALAAHRNDEAIKMAPYQVLEDWLTIYGYKSLVMLDDTYGSDVFRRFLPYKYLKAFKGFRHDSGDPFQYGDDVIALYERNNIDPRSKLIIFSDGLKPELVLKLYAYFKGRIMVAFGMGTNLSNDMGLIKPLSLVMKIKEAAGNPAVKLSNNLNKATGEAEAIERYKRAFGYTNTASEEVVY